MNLLYKCNICGIAVSAPPGTKTVLCIPCYWDNVHKNAHYSNRSIEETNEIKVKIF